MGLSLIPSAWTPPFFVLTSLFHSAWRKLLTTEELITRHLDECIDTFVLQEMRRLITLIAASSPHETLLVRSSAQSEDLACRGRYYSRQCQASLEAVLEAAHVVWGECERLGNELIPLVVQSYRRPLASGHLANEYRLGKKPEKWILESRPSKPDDHDGVYVFNVTAEDAMAPRTRLTCTEKDLTSVLRSVAASSLSSDYRWHYEWVWDGTSLWMVQADRDYPIRGITPGVYRMGIDLRQRQMDLRVFRTDLGGDTITWPKIQCLRSFRECGLDAPKVFILDDKSTLSGLAHSKANQDLIYDLRQLLASPIVIRTDVRASDGSESFLLPRTQTITSIDEAITFLITTSHSLASKKAIFAFLVHHFIPSRASAICLAQPDDSRVRIDAVWGFPDGLLVYPHDSYEVDASGQRRLQKKIRYKYEHLDLGQQLAWVAQRTGLPWSWRSCLTTDDALHLARASHAIARHLGKAVHVMFLVGVDPKTSYQPLLPFYCTTEISSSYMSGPKPGSDSQNKVVIRTPQDYASIAERLAAGQKPDALILKPLPELLRSRDFLIDIADVSRLYNIPIELAGSILSHAYYILRRNNAIVHCIDPFIPLPRKLKFGKLVRDLIPVKIESNNERAIRFTLTGDELLSVLKAKAVEEALELSAASEPSSALEELADLTEIIRTICQLYGRTDAELSKIADEKRAARGGFAQGIVLVETEEIPLILPEQKDTAQDTAELPSMQRATDLVAPQYAGRRRQPHMSVRRPHISGRRVIVPLVPPDSTILSGSTALRLPGSEEVVEIHYLEKTVEIQIRRSGAVVGKLPEQYRLDL